MERNYDILKKAIDQLPVYEPTQEVWIGIDQKISELPLQEALEQLPVYAPEDALWESIEKRNVSAKRSFSIRYAAAAVLLTGSLIGAWMLTNKQPNGIAFSHEKIDLRLQADPQHATDKQYENLKAYCETETLVCKSDDYRRLQQEFELLLSASAQLEEAIGTYNTEPALVQQLDEIEKQKAGLLNEMAKMI